MREVHLKGKNVAIFEGKKRGRMQKWKDMGGQMQYLRRERKEESKIK